ncbi:transcriptional regulator with XRE-family HTH domain [Sphingobium sp. B1D3A]|uniref:Transcriptional regulator with XRE-family HTH domain n=1 Tax=Sphingobium lignivorans TaxID=2735886 RepID=A0ABR6NGI1_9SPHN|nr:transcriptional regulator with XRE-family HTH domain [Sphingobium lignivorans]
MSRGTRLFVGQKVRQLRLDNRMDQKAMARLLDISVSYLSQLENNDRPLTAKVKAALASAFPLDWSAFDERQEEQLLGAFNWALANPGLGSPPPDPERAERLHLHYPDFAARYVELHHALRQTQERLAMMEEAIASDAAPARARALGDGARLVPRVRQLHSCARCRGRGPLRAAGPWRAGQ